MSGVEWLDIEPVAAPPVLPVPYAGPDAAPPGGPREPMAARPVRPLRVGLAAAVLLLALMALVGAALLWRSRTAVRSVPPGPRDPAAVMEEGYRGVDATGCPISTVCTSTARASDAVRAAVAQEFPGAAVLDQQTVTDVGTGLQMRTALTARAADGVVVEVVSQCAPDIRHVVGTPAPPLGDGPFDVGQVVPGPPGCGVAVTAHVPPATTIPASQVAVIALDPAVQLQR